MWRSFPSVVTTCSDNISALSPSYPREFQTATAVDHEPRTRSHASYAAPTSTMDRELEINLILFRIKIRFPSSKYTKSPETDCATLSRSSSDWEFYKMNNTATRRPFTLTKSYAALNFICDLEDNDATEHVEDIEDDYCVPHEAEALDNYNLPENATSEDIYELVDTLPMPGRVPDSRVASESTAGETSVTSVPATASGEPVTPRYHPAHTTHRSVTNKLPLPPRGSWHRPPSPPPRYTSNIKIIF